jgi:hypothetical protein
VSQERHNGLEQGGLACGCIANYRKSLVTALRLTLFNTGQSERFGTIIKCMAVIRKRYITSLTWRVKGVKIYTINSHPAFENI